MSRLLVNDNEVECISAGESGRYNEKVKFIVNCPIEEAVNIFKDNATLKIIWADNTESDYSDFKILDSMIYYTTDYLYVIYRKLTDLEKMIQLHYGGVN